MKNSEQRFRHIFENSPAMVYVTDLNGIMLDINEAGARMLGYESREDVLGLKAAQAI